MLGVEYIVVMRVDGVIEQFMYKMVHSSEVPLLVSGPLKEHRQKSVDAGWALSGGLQYQVQSSHHNALFYAQGSSCQGCQIRMWYLSPS